MTGLPEAAACMPLVAYTAPRQRGLDADIAALDLEPIAYKIVADEGWSLEKVDRVTREYRAFLQVVRYHAHEGSIAPTRDIDTFWHAHILDTERYIEDCNHLFGSCLHHYPYSGVFGEADAEKQAKRVSRGVELIQKILTSKEHENAL